MSEVHNHSTACRLLEALALPHGTPVIEWHRWAVSPFVDDVPIAATAAGWRYLQVAMADAVDRSAVAFNDTGWALGDGPFGWHGISGDVYGTPWNTQSALWVRRPVHTVPGYPVELSGLIDNIIAVYWNGTQVLAADHSGSTAQAWSVTIPAEDVLLDNVLAIRAQDDTTLYSPDGTFLSVQAAHTGPVVAAPAGEDYEWTLSEDRTAALAEYQAGHGRKNPLERVEALWSKVVLARARITGDLPSSGERFRLTLNPDVATALGVDEAERPRFTGEITDDAVEFRRGDTTYLAIDGLGRRDRLKRVPLNATRPAELDGERARRLLRLAQVDLPFELGTIDPGTVDLLEEEYVGSNTDRALDQVRVDSLGQLVEHRSGRLDWQDAEHRRGTAPLLTLAGDQHVIMPFSWKRSVATVVNDAEVTWGAGRDIARVTDPTSTDTDTGLGPYPAQLDTRLSNEDDAYWLAAQVVGRYARPAWMLPELVVDVVRTAGPTAGAVLSLSHSDRFTSEALPPDGPFTAGDLFVEGTTETFGPKGWRMAIAASDPRVSGVGLRYIDLPALLPWIGVNPALTYLDVVTITDPADLGEEIVHAGYPDTVLTGPIDTVFHGGAPDTTEFTDTPLDGGTP